MEVPVIDAADTSDDAASEMTFMQQFEAKLNEYDEAHSGNKRKPWTAERIAEVIDIIKKARDLTMSCKQRRTSMEYYWMAKYDIATEANQEHLIMKRKSKDDQLVFIIPRNEYFSVLREIHETCGHGGRDKMISTYKSKFYIPKKAVEFFIELCPKCAGKQQLRKKGFTRPIATQLSHDFNIRGQVDVIYLHEYPDGEYNFLMNYQDDATKFSSFRPLKTNEPSEVAMELMKIFTTFGAPYILQSHNGREFAAKVVEELASIWPEIKIVHGTPKTDTETAERSNQEIVNMLRLWMARNESINWSLGCFHIQYEINASFNRMLGRSPYKALFGVDPKAGLTDSGIPSEVLMNVETEEELKTLSDQVLERKKRVAVGEPNNVVENENETMIKIEILPNEQDSLEQDDSDD